MGNSTTRLFTETGKLKVYTFNVSQGDHILMHLPDGSFGIIDCFFHTPMRQEELPALSVLRYLHQQFPHKPPRIAFIYISHPDHDHLKGITDLLDWVEANDIQVEYFWWFGGTELPEFFGKLKRHARAFATQEKKNPKFRSQVQGFERKLRRILQFKERRPRIFERMIGVSPLPLGKGKGVYAYALAPLHHHLESFQEVMAGQYIYEFFVQKGELREQLDKNLVSSIVKFVFGPYHLVFSGDTHRMVWLDALAHLQANDFGVLQAILTQKAQFVKAGHHGSHFSSDTKIWEEVLDLNDSEAASHVVFSAGIHKRWKHPHTQTVREIEGVCTRFDQSIPQDVPLCTMTTTNGCTACEPMFDGYFSLDEYLNTSKAKPSKKQKGKIDRILGQHLRVKSAQEQSSAPLGVLMFEFDSEAEGIKLFKGTSSRWKNLRFARKHVPCALHNTRHCPEVGQRT
ncbi:MAG: hypothetical protein AAFQ92_10460 [Bacteroidota bacterium]